LRSLDCISGQWGVTKGCNLRLEGKAGKPSRRGCHDVGNPVKAELEEVKEDWKDCAIRMFL
jgi:hypothetical protein